MALRKVLSVSIASHFLLIVATTWPDSVSAQDMSKTVVPVTQLKWIGPGAEAKFATGFCLSEDCRFVGTNYHVALTAEIRKIKGDKVLHRYLATGPDDDGATINGGSLADPMKYNLGRDIAVYELRYPLRNHHGIPFSLDDLQLGQEVDIYAYPKDPISPIRSLLKFHAAFKGETTKGLLAFEYNFSNGKAIRPGASGGLVVDSKSQQIVGILSGVARDGEPVAMAVPVESLANFVSKVEPWLAQSLFPSANKESISPASVDLYPKFVPPPAADSLQHRPEEPFEVSVLRKKAQTLANSMRNFIAAQSFEWGSGHKEPAAHAEYEVRVIDDYQQFRELPDGKKELLAPADPRVNGFVVPADEWSRLPRMVGTDFRLKVNHAGNLIVNGRQIKVFKYYASVEDDLCEFAPIEDFLFFTIGRAVTTACYGEVWTDSETNIIRISKHLDLSQKLRAYRGWDEVQVVLTYGWLRRRDESPRLVPLTISTEAGYKKHTFWCQGTFTNYRIFSSRAEIMNASNNRVQSPLR